jgi:hypothetical protein
MNQLLMLAADYLERDGDMDWTGVPRHYTNSQQWAIAANCWTAMRHDSQFSEIDDFEKLIEVIL